MKIAIRVILAALALALLVLAGVRIFSSIKKNSATAGTDEPIFIVRSHKVARANVVDEIRISGTIRPQNEVEVYPKIAGRITALNFDVGDVVKAGDILAVIEHNEIALQEHAAKGSLAIAQANEAVAQNDLERTKMLLQEKAVSHTQFEQVQLKYDMARAQTKVAKAQADIASQQRMNATITSLINGTVTARVASVGGNVSPQMAVFTIQDMTKLKMVTSVDVMTLLRLKKGTVVGLSFDQLPKNKFSGIIKTLSPSLDTQSRRASIEIDMQNHASNLVPNMFVNGFLILKRFENALVIPNVAISTVEDKPRVFRIIDGKIQVVIPILGQRDEINSVVLEGLNEGDDIAISGFESLSDGKSVTIEDTAR